ncbi:hypothetical protein [Desulfocurvus vexinensis]|uniref:hypothetical protein n=1 Tax=Desulfocurvus vexinensis TaxID=399548 RepID=UPI00048DBAD5|nr:hypothetical protein [Desulfocurvus vexinensis]
MQEFDEYPEFEYLASIEGFLVPIAHIKAIGWVEKTFPMPDEPYEGDQWYFRVHLDQPLGDAGDGVARDLAAFYPSEEEAETARMQLAGRVNDFYKNQFVNSMFGGKLH